MEPPIQYAKTEDGVDLAFAIAGEGPPVVALRPPPLSHVQREWTLFSYIYTASAETSRVILYDPRGAGLSDRDAADFSMETMLGDLETIADHTAPETLALFALQDAVPLAIAYAAGFPNRVTHLILVDGWTKGADFSASAATLASDALMDQDWTVYTETLARVLSGIDDPNLAGVLGEHIRSCIEPEAFRAFVEAERSYDVSSLLASVKAQTLVLQNNDSPWASSNAGQKLAAGIPDARFLAIDDMAYAGVVPLFEEFMGTGKPAPASQPTALRAVLFTDVVDHTELMSRLGDERGREVLREHERITRELLVAHDGTEVKAMGDGFMASFGSVTKSVDCAIALQRAFAERDGVPLSIRAGIDAGEPIEDDGDLFGGTVILASRIATKAKGGEILVADTVRGLCTGKGFLFADRGEFVPKGFEEPVRLYEVRWQGD